MAELNLNKHNFESEVLHSDKPVLVDFWASWCGPCKMLSPEVSKIAEEYEGSVKVGKVNVDDEMELAQRYRIASIPALLLFKDGKVVDTSIGYVPTAKIRKMLG